MSDSPSKPIRYLVSHNGETKGPLDLEMIDAFILSGHYPQGIRIRAEESNDWKGHTPAVDVAAPPIQADSPPLGARIPKWLLWVGEWIALWFVVKVVNEAGVSQTSSSSASPRSTPTRYRSVYSTPRSTPYWTPPPFGSAASSTRSWTPSSSLGSTPTSAATPADVVYKGANGRTYRVPHYDYLRLSKQRAAIDQEDAAITALQAKQTAYSDNIELERAYLDRTSQYQIDAFNEKIDRLNSAHAQLKQRINAFNRSIDAFNAELERVGTPER